MIYLSEYKYRFRSATGEERAALGERCAAMHTTQYYLQTYSWWIYEGDLRLPGDVANDINLIVTGDLIVDGWYNDYCRGEGMLVVMGAMRCQHILSWYGLSVRGNLDVQGLLYQYYNDWCFECAGRVSARAFLGEDKSCQFGEGGEIFEGYSGSYGEKQKGCRDSLSMLGLATGGWDAVTAHVMEAEAAGRSPFLLTEARPWPGGGEGLRVRALLHPDTPEAELVGLAQAHPFEVAARRRLPGAMQDTLAAHADARVRWAIAAAPDLSPANLQRLAGDPDAAVRAAIAARDDCPEHLFPKFAQDAAAKVRAALVHAHGSPNATWLAPLASDLDCFVRRAVAVVPQLPPELQTQLLCDEDVVTINRLLRTQVLSGDVLRGQFESPRRQVRLALANAACSGNVPFDSLGEALRREALCRFLLDPSDEVRQAAAVYWLPQSFYEANAERLATDVLAEVRQVAAARLCDPQWLNRLVRDTDTNVREVVSKNPRAPVEALRFLTGSLIKKPFDSQIKSAVYALLENPCLPADVVVQLYRYVPPAYPLDAHPNAPFSAMVERAAGYVDCRQDDDDFPIFQRCLQACEKGEPNPEDLTQLYEAIFSSTKAYFIDCALANATCPPYLLDRYLTRYWRKSKRGGGYEMCGLGANPALEPETQLRIAAFLLEEGAHELLKGFCRNPVVSAEIFAALAFGLPEESDRSSALFALRLWHGLEGDAAERLPRAALAKVDWRPLPLDPQEAEAEADTLIAQGNAHQERGDYHSALQSFEEAILISPGNSSSALLRARHAAIKLCRAIAFEELCEFADEREPERFREKGLAEAGACLNALASQMLDSLSDAAPERAVYRDAQYFLAWDAYVHSKDVSRLEEALARVDAAIRLTRPEGDEALQATRARLLVKLDRCDEVGLETVREVLRGDPFCMDFGILAEDALNSLTDEYPQNPDYCTALGFFHVRGEHDQAAIDAFTQALSRMDNFPDGAVEWAYTYDEVLNQRGQCHDREGSGALAVADFSAALEIASEWGRLYYNRGMTYFGHDEGELARADFERALEQEPNEPDYLYSMICVLESLGELDAALEYAQQLVETDETAENRNLLGWVHVRRREFDVALAQANGALALDPDYDLALDMRGCARLGLGQPEVAREDFEAALALDPECAGFRFHRGFARYLAGDLAGAHADYEATRGDEDLEDAPFYDRLKPGEFW